MLYQVEMTVLLPSDMPVEMANEIKAREKAYSQELQNSGVWRHIWRQAGTYKNTSIFDCRDNEHLHQVITGLPLFPWMKIEVTALCRHPSSIREDDK